MTCKFPNCNRHATDNGFCIGHIDHGIVIAKPKINMINKRSEKMDVEMIEYKKQLKIFLLLNRTCEIKSPECTGKATCVNHQRRRGKNLLNQDDWEAACHACNNYCESHDKWARENGHLKSKFDKNASAGNKRNASVIGSHEA